MWLKNLIQNILSPLIGLLIEINEVVRQPEPRYLAVAAGFILMGIPVDATLRVLQARSTDISALSSGQPSDSSESTPVQQSSSSTSPSGGNGEEEM